MIKNFHWVVKQAMTITYVETMFACKCLDHWREVGENGHNKIGSLVRLIDKQPKRWTWFSNKQ